MWILSIIPSLSMYLKQKEKRVRRRTKSSGDKGQNLLIADNMTSSEEASHPPPPAREPQLPTENGIDSKVG